MTQIGTRRRGGFWARTALGAAALALASAPGLADVKAGVDAWSAGDYARAVSEWQGPAAAGDADALFNLAQAFRLGRGVEADAVRARSLYEEAARRGHVKAADNLGLVLYQEGEAERAMPLIRAAAERGDPRAQYVLALSHFNADHAPRDWVRAYALMSLAKDAGLPQASGALAQMDTHIPPEQRSQGQSLARELDAKAKAHKTAELAAVDFALRPPVAATPAPKPPAPAPVLAAARPEVAVAAATKPAARTPGRWRVQLGTFAVAANADRMWKQLAAKPALSGTTKSVVTSGKYTRLLATGFASQAEAARACATLKRDGQACLVAGQG
jgi:TPR repeat protein